MNDNRPAIAESHTLASRLRNALGLERFFDLIIGADTLSSRTVPGRWWLQLLWSFLLVALCTQISRMMLPLPHFGLDNIIVIYMLAVVVVAIRYGYGPAIFTSLLSVIAINLFFVSRYLVSAEAGAENLITLGAMLVIAVIVSGLVVRAKQQTELSSLRAQRSDQLYAMSVKLAGTTGVDNLVQIAQQHIASVFNCQVSIALNRNHGQGAVEQPANTLSMPLMASRGTLGLLQLCFPNAVHPFGAEQRHLLETFANQTALAIERSQLVEEARAAMVEVETERLRNALLSSVSHDLRTPLTTISGASSTLLDSGDALDPSTRHELVNSIYEEADRLNRLVRNLLDMTRLESGVQVHREWQLIDEVIGVALTRLEKSLAGRPVQVNLSGDLPPVRLDGTLIEQVLVNLVENAIKYTPEQSEIDISARSNGSEIVVCVADYGPGIPPADLERIFDKFQRGQRQRTESSGAERGVGLGLSICRGIIDAHAGRIWAENRPEGGAIFSFTLPVTPQPQETEPAIATK